MPLWLGIVLLGIIEGITEFLPISSTGHLLIAQQMGWVPGQSDLFNVVIQSGAVLAVLPLFPDRLRQFFTRWQDPLVRDYLLKIAVAFVITGVGGLVLEKRHFKLDDDLEHIASALFIGGVLFLIVEKNIAKKILGDRITWTVAVAVGIGQLVAAVFPGTSRSGITILAALALGVGRVPAVEFTFLVGIPTMLAAGGLKIFKALHHGNAANAENWPMVILASVVAAIVSFIAVKWLLRYIQTRTFVAFGWYRIALAIVIGFLLWQKPELRHLPPADVKEKSKLTSVGFDWSKERLFVESAHPPVGPSR
jgi:undecaprenyl-diphosphatase